MNFKINLSTLNRIIRWKEFMFIPRLPSVVEHFIFRVDINISPNALLPRIIFSLILTYR